MSSRPRIQLRKKPKDPMIGRRFGDLLVLRRLQDKKTGAMNTRARVLCQCRCGNRVVIPRMYLRRKGNPKTHCGECKGPSGRGTRFAPEYSSWSMMLKRCYDETHIAYKDYGGRGIRVCAEWQGSFDKFLTDMGPRPTPSHTLDRKNVNGNYEKGNCRWATPKEQATNKRANLPNA